MLTWIKKFSITLNNFHITYLRITLFGLFFFDKTYYTAWHWSVQTLRTYHQSFFATQILHSNFSAYFYQANAKIIAHFKNITFHKVAVQSSSYGRFRSSLHLWFFSKKICFLTIWESYSKFSCFYLNSSEVIIVQKGSKLNWIKMFNGWTIL